MTENGGDIDSLLAEIERLKQQLESEARITTELTDRANQLQRQLDLVLGEVGRLRSDKDMSDRRWRRASRERNFLTQQLEELRKGRFG